MFNRIKNLKTVNRAIDTLRINERGTVATLNTIVPEIIEGIIAGDNVAIANNLLDALQGGRKKEVGYFLRRMLPHTYDALNGKFGKKIQDEKQYDAIIARYLAFKESGQTVFGWIKVNTTVEHREVDYFKRTESSLKQAIKHGLTADQILTILNSVIAEDAKKHEAAKIKGVKHDPLAEVPFAAVA